VGRGLLCPAHPRLSAPEARSQEFSARPSPCPPRSDPSAAVVAAPSNQLRLTGAPPRWPPCCLHLGKFPCLALGPTGLSVPTAGSAPRKSASGGRPNQLGPRVPPFSPFPPTQRTLPPPPAARNAAPEPSDALALMAAELREVRLELAQVRKELAAARLENDQLRLQLGKQLAPAPCPAPAHSTPLHPSVSSSTAAGTTTPPVSPTRPYSEPDALTFDVQAQDELMASVHLGVHPRDPQASPEGRKHPRRALSAGPGPHDL
jgi:hypothetical protein